MNVIGIRVAPSVIHYTIIDATDRGELNYNCEEIIIPKSLEVPQMLAYIRTTLFSVLTEFNIEKAGIRTTESIAQNINITRINIEGVIQELLANCNVTKYYLASISKFSSYLNENVDTIKGFISGDNNFLNVEETPKSHKEIRESILTAFAALEI